MHEDPLLRVALKAIEDEQFWRDLNEDAAAALRRAGLELEPDDMSTLVRLLRHDRIPWTLSELMTSLHENLRESPGVRWLSRWPERS